MSGIFVVVRQARKRHQCDMGSRACQRWIEPGQLYRYGSLPPHSELGNEKWWHHAECGACADLYGRPIKVVDLL